MGTIEDFERLDAPPDVKMLAFSLIRRGAGSYHIIPTARMLNTRHGKVAALGAKMRRHGLNASLDPEIIEIPETCPYLEALAPLRDEAPVQLAQEEDEEPTVVVRKKPGRPKKGVKR